MISPACFSSLYIGILAATYRDLVGNEEKTVSVPFTSGSSLQLDVQEELELRGLVCFSSLYIGILAAT